MNNVDKDFRNRTWGQSFVYSVAPIVMFGAVIGLIARYADKQNKPKNEKFVSTIYAAPNHTDTVTVYDIGRPLQLIDRDGHISPYDVSVGRDKFFAVFNIERNDKLLVQADSLNNLRVIQNITKDTARKKSAKQK